MAGVPELLRKIERVIVGAAAGEGKGGRIAVVGQFLRVAGGLARRTVFKRGN
ncbi:MAG: hypothetical protein ABSB42_16560 [Tepidisphaeraceae bacterium]